MSYAGVRFPRRDPADFGPEVKRRVAAYFAERSLSDKANASMVVKTAVLIAVTIGSYLLLLSNRIPPWGMLGLAVLMGVGIAGLGSIHQGGCRIYGLTVLFVLV